MHTAKVLTIKEHRGAPRLWLEGSAPAKSGFLPGLRFSVTQHGRGVLLQLQDDGGRKVSHKQYASGQAMPVLDINSGTDLAPLTGCTTVRVVFGVGRVLVTPLASELRRQRRLARVRDRLQADQPLAVGGIACGGGVLSHAVHTGLADAGVPAELVFANEIREELLEHAATHNEVFTASTQHLAMPLQELAFDHEVLNRVAEVDLLELGLPCSGASVAGRAKRKLGIPEEHPDVGHLVVGALALIARLNPAVLVLENVVPYRESASAVLLRQQLRDLGYDVHEREFLGTEWGELEARRRWCLVAVTRGIAFDFATLTPGVYPVRTLATVMEAPAAVADRWSPMAGLKAKEERDRAAGKGFMMQIYDGSETHIGTLTKGIAKNRSTDPKFRHPDQPDLLRIPTAREHARCKGVPEHLVADLAQTTAHELLGQGIVYRPFRAVAAHLGAALRLFASTTLPVAAVATAFKVAA